MTANGELKSNQASGVIFDDGLPVGHAHVADRLKAFHQGVEIDALELSRPEDVRCVVLKIGCEVTDSAYLEGIGNSFRHVLRDPATISRTLSAS